MRVLASTPSPFHLLPFDIFTLCSLYILNTQMYIGIIVGLVIGVVAFFLLLTIANRIFYFHFARAQPGHYLPPPVPQTSRQSSKRSKEIQHASVLSALASPSMASPIAGVAKSLSFSRLSANIYMPLRASSLEHISEEQELSRPGSAMSR